MPHDRGTYKVLDLPSTPLLWVWGRNPPPPQTMSKITLDILTTRAKVREVGYLVQHAFKRITFKAQKDSNKGLNLHFIVQYKILPRLKFIMILFFYEPYDLTII